MFSAMLCKETLVQVNWIRKNYTKQVGHGHMCIINKISVTNNPVNCEAKCLVLTVG